jgi:hypothetical protein
LNRYTTRKVEGSNVPKMLECQSVLFPGNFCPGPTRIALW